jgi:aspartokinase/homoserine dehydrogenase 1
MSQAAIEPSVRPPASAAASGAARLAAHKFGGSSLADADCFRRVAAILRAQPEPHQLVVASAMRGTTDALIALADAAARRGTPWKPSFDDLRERHLATTRDLLGDRAQPTIEWLERGFAELAELLHALGVLGTSSREAQERIQGFGEVWSARMLADFLRSAAIDCACLDARDVLVIAHGELGAAVDWQESARRFSEWRNAHPAAWTVVTGFVARTRDGRPTVLGRNGSDYSASIFAALASASELTLWGDTDGVLSADPRLVPDAVSLDALSYDEACELAYFGAKVIHPQTLTPAIGRGLPVRIRNTFRPAHAGTRIGDAHVHDAVSPVKGLSAVRDLALITLEGAGMIGVPGTAERTFGALRAAGVSVVMISQGSSEHSICCVVRGGDAPVAEAALRRAFAAEITRGEIHSVSAATDVSVLAAVGDGMAGTPGVAARLFGALARTGVNIRAIAQGASERNISVAVANADAPRALRAAHAAFWLSPQTLSVGLVGHGKVGAALLRQIAAARPRLLREANLDLRLRAVATSRTMWLGEADGADNWSSAADCASDIERLAAHVHVEHLPHALLIDCSASDAIADRYAGWLAAGIHVVTPNKHAGAGPLARWQAIRAAIAGASARFRYEATVGAGLPVISTLRDLLDTGDAMISVEGILSGTLAWLFNRYDGRVAFSELVREAHALGYTEPDPRDDLSGTDVARKLVILAREAGGVLALEDVEVESLVPASLRGVDAKTFFARLPELDDEIAQRFARAQRAGCVLRYVARLDRDGRARVGLAELAPDHAFAHLRLTDNIVQFTTERYRDNPLVVQGPGAGPEVTAAGVFADVLRVAAALGAKL